MKIKQSLMLLISIVLCIAMYPFYGIAFMLMVLITASTAVTVLFGRSRTGIIPIQISLIISLIFSIRLGTEYAVPGFLAMIAATAGFVMGVSVKGRWALHGILIFSGGVFLLAMVGAIFAVNHTYDTDIIKQLIDILKDAAYDGVIALGLATSGTIGKMKDIINLVYDRLTTLVPAMMILASAGMAYISFGITRYILKKNKVFLPMLPDRRHLIMRKSGGWILVLVWVFKMFITNERIGYALANIEMILSAFFFVCGVSLVLHLIEYKIKSAGVKWLLRILLFISICSFGSALISELLVMAAIIDSVWNFRRINVTLQ